MRFLTICFIVILKKNYRNLDYLFSEKSNTLFSEKSNTLYNKDYTYKHILGNDERYSKNETDTKEINKIIENFHKKKLLNILQDDKVSINTKLDLLKDNNIKPANLKSGGLMDDFNFKID